MIQYKTANTNDELRQILALQKGNLKEHISVEEVKAEGFVTIHHNFDLLKRMNDACPHIIAKDKDQVVGYTLCMHPMFRDEIEILKPMFQQLDQLLQDPTSSIEGTSENFVVMGQVCIDKQYRRRGIFRKLYEKMKEELIPTFDAIITEVNAANIRSKKAHEAIGFKLLAIHQAEGQTWELIYLR